MKKDGPGRFRTEAHKLDFQTCYFNLANDEQAYSEFVSERVNEFKIIHFRRKTNREGYFDATEELRDLTKNNGTTTSGSEKKRTRIIFGVGTKSVEKLMQGMQRDLELNQNFFLGDNVDHKQNAIYNQKIIPKRTIKKRSNRTTALRKLNREIF